MSVKFPSDHLAQERAHLGKVDWSAVELVDWEPTGPEQRGRFVCPFCSRHARAMGQAYMPCRVCAKTYGLMGGAK